MDSDKYGCAALEAPTRWRFCGTYTDMHLTVSHGNDFAKKGMGGETSSWSVSFSRVAVANQSLASLLSSVKLLQCIWHRTHYRICSTLRTFMRSRPSSKELLTPVSTPEDDLRHHLLALQLEPIEETKPLDLVETNPEDTSDWGWFEDFASCDAEEPCQSALLFNISSFDGVVAPPLEAAKAIVVRRVLRLVTLMHLLVKLTSGYDHETVSLYDGNATSYTAFAMAFTATRPQSARPSSTCHRTGPKTNKITLGMYRFQPNTSALERVGPVDVHSTVLALLNLMADDSVHLHQAAHQVKMHRFRAHIPSTVVIGRHSEPAAWYYTNKEGFVLKKHATHCTWKYVREAFCGRFHPSQTSAHDGGGQNLHWPVAVAKFADGRMRLLTLHAVYALLRTLDAQCPSETLSSHPFCIQTFVPPAKRVRYISIYTMIRNINDCHVVVAELPPNYREQTHDNLDVNMATEPIELLEAENSLVVESIKRTTLLLIHHVNRKNTASDTPVISKLVAEYMIHTKDNECYLTAILGVSWQNGDQVQLADFQTQKIHDIGIANNQLEPQLPKSQKAVARQIQTFAKSLKGSTELYEAAERHAAECQEAAEKFQAQVVALRAELELVKAQLDDSSAFADAQRKIKFLEGHLELRDKNIAQLEETVAAQTARANEAEAELYKERNRFCVAMTETHEKIDALTMEIASTAHLRLELDAQVAAKDQALHAAKTTIQALQEALDRQKLETHHAQHENAKLELQLHQFEAENDKLKALLPFASVKKVNYSDKMHLHDMAMVWPEFRMEISLVNRALGAHYSAIKRTFAAYKTVKVPILAHAIALGRTHALIPHQLNFAQLLECMEKCHVVTTRFPAVQLEALFIKCTAPRWEKIPGVKTTTAGVSMPRGMTLHEFMELLVRIASIRGGGKSGLVADHLHLMMEECIYPNVHT
ncbi:hypothetical protein AeRB84_004767 [Aphanomyces euteiches]|nr:hypothetical protein AeRB84_004767 [Aphanomyces euteiches]